MQTAHQYTHQYPKVPFTRIFSALLLMTAICVYAQENNHSTLSPQATTAQPALKLSVFGQASTDHLVWPLMPGETLRGLAEKAYPNNVELQQRLIAKTISLSRERAVKLGPDTVFTHPQLIVLPNQPKLNQMTQPIKTADAQAVKKVSPNLALSLSLGARQTPVAMSKPVEQPVKPEPAPSVLAPVVSNEIKPNSKADMELKRAKALPARVEHYDENTVITIDTTVRSDEELAAMKAHR